MNYGYTTQQQLKELIEQLESAHIETVSFQQVISFLFPSLCEEFDAALNEQYVAGFKAGRTSSFIQEQFEEIGWTKQYEDKRYN